MMRIVPEVRALYERVRRPDILRFLAAVRRPRLLRFVPPDSALYAVVRKPGVRLGALVAVIASVAVLSAPLGDRGGPAPDVAGAAVADAPADEAGPSFETKVAEALEAESPIARAWRERALEREAARVAPRFAEQYRPYRVTPELAMEIHLAAAKYDFEPRVAFGLVRVESGFRRTAVSFAGAVGYTQLLPSTARYMVPGTTRTDLFDTRTNLEIGFKYLRYLTDKYDGDLHLALTAYNRGPGTVDRLLRQGRNPDNGYAGAVLRG